MVVYEGASGLSFVRDVAEVWYADDLLFLI